MQYDRSHVTPQILTTPSPKSNLGAPQLFPYYVLYLKVDVFGSTKMSCDDNMAAISHMITV